MGGIIGKRNADVICSLQSHWNGKRVDLGLNMLDAMNWIVMYYVQYNS